MLSRTGKTVICVYQKVEPPQYQPKEQKLKKRKKESILVLLVLVFWRLERCVGRSRPLFYSSLRGLWDEDSG